MACALSQSSKTAVDFEGPTGASFTITIAPDPGSSLRQTAATYDGNTVGGATATFTLVNGVKKLVVTYAAAQLNELGDLAEICSPGNNNLLRGIRSTAIFTRLYFVEGL
jgi:hypothetical protein